MPIISRIKKIYAMGLTIILLLSFLLPTTVLAADDVKFSFAVISDMHIGETENDFTAIATGIKLINEKKPAFVFILGDLTATGTKTQFANFKIKVLKPLVNIPIALAAGNHDFHKNTTQYNTFLNSSDVQNLLLPEFKNKTTCGKNQNFATFTFQGKQFVTIDPYNNGYDYYLYQEELDCLQNISSGALVFRHESPYGLTCSITNAGVCGSSVMGQNTKKKDKFKGTVNDLNQFTNLLIAKGAAGIFTGHTHGFHQGMCSGSGGSIFHLENGDFGTGRDMEFVSGWTAADKAFSFSIVDVLSNGSVKATIYVYDSATKTYAPQTKPFPAKVTSQLTFSKSKSEKQGVDSTCTSIQPSDTSGGATATAETATSTSVTAERASRFAPNLEITIPGLKFTTEVAGEEIAGGQMFAIPYIAQYINAVYKYLLGAGSLIVIIIIMFAGFRWMVAGGNVAQIDGAKKMISNGVLGLMLLFCTALILKVINPQLLELRSLLIFAPKQEAWIMPVPDEADADSSSVTTGAGAPAVGKSSTARLCDSWDSCQKLCEFGKPKTEAVAAAVKAAGYSDSSGMVDPRIDIAQYLSGCAGNGGNKNEQYRSCGIVFRGNDSERRLLPTVMPGLANAAKIAAEKGYALSIGSTYRSAMEQVAKVCTKMTHIVPGTKPCGPGLACPGGSNHMYGYAMDLCLINKTGAVKCLTPPTGDSAPCEKNTEITKNNANLKMLNDILFQAGWYKYCKELWHFEFTDKPAGSFRTKTY